ncbi:MAG: type II toxin-antitoxin system mRNA interferase toxin, RelE/StbE family [Alphaproteobacteria bacterium]|nr:type II toxin-antitoxin system mRNA interferase toxin, RelE/StbE family [Alphaproteobacteria bacterium]
MDRLDLTVKDRILNAISRLREDPRPPGCKKLIARDEWRIKVGDYRIIYEIHDRVLIIKVVRVGHRSKAY